MLFLELPIHHSRNTVNDTTGRLIALWDCGMRVKNQYCGAAGWSVPDYPNTHDIEADNAQV